MCATDITAAEQIYRQALAALSEGIVVQDKDGAITSCNPAAERILGLSVDQMMGVRSIDPRWRAVHEDGSPFPGEEHPAMVTLRTGLPVEGVIMGVRKPDGSLSWISINSTPFRAGSDRAGEDAVVTTFTDITARRPGEASLRESEERFQAAITTMRDAVAILSPVRDETGGIVDFRYDYANDAHCELVGRDREQLLGRGFGEVFLDWARSERFELYRQVALTGEPCRSEDFHPEQAWGPEFARRVLDSVVARVGERLVVSARDVSERRRIEAQLRASEERFDAAVGSMLDAFAILSPVRDEQGEVVDFRWEYVNGAYCELVGFDRGRLVGHRLVELLPGFPASGRFAVYRRVSETGEPCLSVDVAEPEAWAGGRVADRVLDTMIVAAGENVVVTARDVTERHRLEEQLRASEELFRTGVGSLLDGFTICSPVRDETGEIIDFRWEYVNDAACARNGLTREQMLGHRIGEVLPGYTDTDVFELHRRVAQTGEPARVDEVSWQAEWVAGRQVDRAYDGSVVPLGPNIIVTGRDVTEARRNERELRLQAELLELAHDAVIVRDPVESRVRFWNREAEAIYGYSHQEALGKVTHELLATVFPDCRESVDDALARDEQWVGELRHTRKDGRVIAVSSRQAMQRSKDGQPIAIIELNSDITERQRAEREREQALAELEEAQHIAQLGSWRWDPSAGSRVWSAEMYVVYGRDPAAGPMNTEQSFAFVHPDDLERVRGAYARMSEHDAGFEIDYRLVTADGVTRAVHAIARPDPDQPGCYRGTLQDVTEHKRAEQELRLRAELLDLAHDAVIVREPAENRVTFWNREAQAIYGYGRAEALGQVTHELLGTVFPESRQAVEHALAHDGHWAGELHHTRKDSTPIVVSSRQALQRDADGRPLAIIELNSDITERKRVEEALRASEQRFRGGFENSPIGMALTGLDGRLLEVNAAFAKMLGFDDPAQLAGQDFARFKHADDLAATREDVRTIVEGGKAFVAEKRYIRRDGAVVHGLVGSTALLDADGRPSMLYTQVQDITERKLAEAALRASEERFRGGFENSPIGTALTGLDGRLVDVNATFAQMLGFDDPAELAGQSFENIVHPDDLALGRETIKQIMEQGSYHGERRYIHRDGTVVYGLYGATLVRDADGRPSVFFGQVEDITERKHAEAEVLRLNAELERRVLQRTAELKAANQELEAFAYSLAHDLRAPIRAINGFGAALSQSHGEELGDQGRDTLDRIRRASARMGELIDAMLLLSELTRRELSITSVDLGALAREISQELRVLDPARGAEFVIGDGLETVGDERLVRVLMRNLLENAWRFTGPREHARIEVMRAGAGVFAVRDNGVGFNMDFAGLLFKPFARLHREDEFPGLGVGLTTVERIVRRHGGAVWGEGRLGEGATFYFKLEPPTETGS